MARYYKRYSNRSYAKKYKYSSETIANAAVVKVTKTEVPPDNVNVVLVEPLNSQGMRKIKNLTLRIVSQAPVPIVFAVIYVPEGMAPPNLGLGAPDHNYSLYEPNQNVIMSGVISYQSAQTTFKSYLARNLNSGDSIVLAVKPMGYDPTLQKDTLFSNAFTFNYAIAYS